MNTNTMLIKNAEFIVSCDAKDTLYRNASIYIKDGVILDIFSEKEGRQYQAMQVIDAAGKIVFPGLINTHHHLYQILTRNLPEVQNLELFPWLVYLYEKWKYLNENAIYYASLAGFATLLKTGCTTCFDHQYVFPKDGGDLVGAQFAAADELGIRFHASRGSMSLSKKDGGLPPDSVVQTEQEILKDSQRLIETYHDSSRYAMHRVALAPCSPFSVTDTLLMESAKLARAYGVRLHTHLAETKDEERFMLETFSERPLAHMQRLGFIGEDVWYAHGIHFNDAELDLLAETKTGVAHCPISNMKLSSGIARIPEMLQKGIPIGLAVDGSASNDGTNLLEEMRVAYLLHRLQYGYAAPSGYDILKLATSGSARLLGRDDIGSLMTGKAADLFMISSKKLQLVGAMHDPKAVLATVGYTGNVDTTIVNGNIVVKDGRLVLKDEDALFEKCERAEQIFHNH